MSGHMEGANLDLAPRIQAEPLPENPASESPFCHPVYRQISSSNGKINRLPAHEVRDFCRRLNLNRQGDTKILSRRIKTHFKRQHLAEAGIALSAPPIRYLLVIDFEATCHDSDEEYPHEIIEFPVVVVDVHNNCIAGEYHSYIRPKLNPTLTDFCKDLTGISQDQVDTARKFPEVLEEVGDWLRKFGVNGDGNYLVLTDGTWDMQKFLYLQCHMDSLPVPQWGKAWINAKRAFSSYYACPLGIRLPEMAQMVGLTMGGRLHSGLDDARNLAAVTSVMVADGWEPARREFLRDMPEMLEVCQKPLEEYSSALCKHSTEPLGKPLSYVAAAGASGTSKTITSVPLTDQSITARPSKDSDCGTQVVTKATVSVETAAVVRGSLSDGEVCMGDSLRESYDSVSDQGEIATKKLAELSLAEGV